jgi:hypothetical protein
MEVVELAGYAVTYFSVADGLRHVATPEAFASREYVRTTPVDAISTSNLTTDFGAKPLAVTRRPFGPTLRLFAVNASVPLVTVAVNFLDHAVDT